MPTTTDKDDDRKNKPTDADIIDAARDFKKRAEEYWAPIYNQALEDIEFCVNKDAQWDKKSRKSREDAGRPCLSINKIALFVKQQVNSLRANKMTLNAIPVDDTDVAKAKIQDAMLEYVLKSSRADIATDWAYQLSVMGGFGFWRITTEYASHKAFNQDIRVKRIENPQSTYLSPEIKDPTGADATEGITGEWLSLAEFERQYPDHDAISADDGQDIGEWHTADTVFVAEYYRIEYEDDVLYLLSNGTTALKSELEAIEIPADVDARIDLANTDAEGLLALAASIKYGTELQIIDERDTQRKRVMWYKCSREAVLDSTEIMADYIPLILVVGDEQWVENKRYWQSMITNAKDPQILYNYARTAQAEQLSKAMNRPWVADARSIEGHEAHWEVAGTNPNLQYLPYNAIDTDGLPLSPPFLAEAYVGSPDLMREMMTSSDEVKSTIGMFDASLGDSGNETSGRAILARQRQGDQANFHFLDNFKRSYEHSGRVILSMIPHIYDTQRVLRITQDDDIYRTLVINTPANSPNAQKYAKELKDVEVGLNGLFNDVTVGTYDIRIATGSDYNTQREEAREVLIELGRAYPQLMEIAGDQIIRAFDFPEADKIAARLKRMLPPEVLGDEDKDDDDDAEAEAQLPPELMQEIKMMQEQAAQAQAAMQEMAAELSDKTADRELELLKIKVKAETDLAVAKVREAGRTDQEEIKAFTQTLDTILQRTASLADAISQMQATPAEWSQTEYDTYTIDDVMPPAEGAMQMQPAEGEMQMQPAEGEMQMQPAEGEMQMQPAEGGNEMGYVDAAEMPVDEFSDMEGRLPPFDENNPPEGY